MKKVEQQQIQNEAHENTYLVSALSPQRDRGEEKQSTLVSDILPVALLYVLLLAFVFFYGGFSNF